MVNSAKKEGFRETEVYKEYDPNFEPHFDVTKRHGNFDLMVKSPFVYEVFKPNSLLGSENGSFTLVEHRIYSYLLSRNHRTDKNLVYDVPYNLVFPYYTEQGAKRSKVNAIRKNLQSRTFLLTVKMIRNLFGNDTKKMLELFNIDKPEDTSFNPFPTANHSGKFLRIELHRGLKYILGESQEQFTKGDLDMLMSFDREIYYPMYWEVRHNQKIDKEWIVPVEELKKRLGLEGKYPEFANLRRRVLEPARERFEKEYVEFTYALENPNKADTLILRFTKGPLDENGLIGYKAYSFEKTLQDYGLYPNFIKVIHNWVAVGFKSEVGFIWDEEYVNFSLEGFREEFKNRQKNKLAKKISSPPKYIWWGLRTGQWINHVIKRKAESQPLLFEENIGVKLPQETTLSDREVSEWRKMFEGELGKHCKTFEIFMDYNGYTLIEGKWVPQQDN
ncbi:MAG TPA: replication initiation protein [Cyclobacteriaceae bacterium]|jgi:hypothetical protein|nr:replication initiation protein [Cyclobacteriaceae bacterium]